MKATFTCRYKTLNLSIDPGRMLTAKFPGGQRTVVNVTTIEFRNHKLETEDGWEANKVREWMIKHPEDGIKEIKIAEEKPRNLG